MAAGVVGDDSMRDAVLAELPRGQLGALIPRPRFIDPNVDWQPAVVGRVDRSRRRSVIHECQPSGIAMSQDVHGLSAFRARAIRWINSKP